jgi:hypothetical protein
MDLTTIPEPNDSTTPTDPPPDLRRLALTRALVAASEAFHAGVPLAALFDGLWGTWFETGRGADQRIHAGVAGSYARDALNEPALLRWVHTREGQIISSGATETEADRRGERWLIEQAAAGNIEADGDLVEALFREHQEWGTAWIIVVGDPAAAPVALTDAVRA